MFRLPVFIAAATIGIAAAILPVTVADAATSSSPGILAGRVNGDGFDDLVGRRSDGTLQVWYHTGNPSTPYQGAGLSLGSGWGAITRFAMGDVTGEGFADIVGTRSSGELLLYTNTQQVSLPFFGNGVSIGSGWSAGDRFDLGDVNGDGGWADIVATRPDGAIYVYYNRRDAFDPFGANTGLLIGSGWTAIDRFALADVDNDGLADIVASRPDGSLWAFYSNGWNVPIDPYAADPFRVGSGWTIYNRYALAELDGRSYRDVVAGKPDGTLWAYPRSGSLTRPYSLPSPNRAIGTDWQAVG